MEKSSADATVVDNVFVGNLSFFCTAEDLIELFKVHVPIRSASIVKTKSGLSSYYGFVYLENEEDASKVAEIFNGMKFMGRKMKIGIKSSAAAKQVVDGSTVQMFVRFLSEKISERITEETLDNVFSQFGEVVDCIVKEYTSFDASSPPVQSGYAFVHVRQIECAQSIMQRLSSESGKELNGIVFKVSLSHQCTERLQKSKDIVEQTQQGRTPQPNSSRPHPSSSSMSLQGGERQAPLAQREQGGKRGNSRFFHGRAGTAHQLPSQFVPETMSPHAFFPQSQNGVPKDQNPISTAVSSPYFPFPPHLHTAAPPQFVPAWAYPGVPPVHMLSPVPTVSPPAASPRADNPYDAAQPATAHFSPSTMSSPHFSPNIPGTTMPTMFHSQSLVYPPGYPYPFPHSTPVFTYQMIDSSHVLAQPQGPPPRHHHP